MTLHRPTQNRKAEKKQSAPPFRPTPWYGAAVATRPPQAHQIMILRLRRLILAALVLVAASAPALAAYGKKRHHSHRHRSKSPGSKNSSGSGDGTGSFGPTDTNLRAGQPVHYWQFIEAACHGSYQVDVSYVTDNGPSGSAPVPGLPGQGPGVPVGSLRFTR